MCLKAWWPVIQGLTLKSNHPDTPSAGMASSHHTTAKTMWHAIKNLPFLPPAPLFLSPLSVMSRREQGVSGQPASMVVEGVQVALPSYEEAVYGSGGGASLPPPQESRVQIVLSEGPQGAEGGEGPSRAPLKDTEICLPSTSSCHAETVLVHQAPTPSSSSCSSWLADHPGGACAAPLPLRRDSESSDQHSLLSVTSVDDFSDGRCSVCLRVCVSACVNKHGCCS